MDITEAPKPSLWFVLGLVLIFFVMGVVPLYMAIIELIKLINDISSQNEIVVFKKGSFYLFGVGLGLLMFSLGVFYSTVLNIKLSDFATKVFTFLLVGIVVITFLIPQIVHFSVSLHLENNGYIVCKEKSRRWLHNVKIVYLKNLPCKE